MNYYVIFLSFFVIVCDLFELFCNSMCSFELFCNSMCSFELFCNSMWSFELFCDSMCSFKLFCDSMWSFELFCDSMWFVWGFFYAIVCDLFKLLICSIQFINNKVWLIPSTSLNIEFPSQWTYLLARLRSEFVVIKIAVKPVLLIMLLWLINRQP